jgi:hypothetical protein
MREILDRGELRWIPILDDGERILRDGFAAAYCPGRRLLGTTGWSVLTNQRIIYHRARPLLLKLPGSCPNDLSIKLAKLNDVRVLPRAKSVFFMEYLLRRVIELHYELPPENGRLYLQVADAEGWFDLIDDALRRSSLGTTS